MACWEGPAAACGGHRWEQSLGQASAGGSQEVAKGNQGNTKGTHPSGGSPRKRAGSVGPGHLRTHLGTGLWLVCTSCLL